MVMEELVKKKMLNGRTLGGESTHSTPYPEETRARKKRSEMQNFGQRQASVEGREEHVAAPSPSPLLSPSHLFDCGIYGQEQAPNRPT